MRGFALGNYWCYRHESNAGYVDAYTWLGDDVVVLLDAQPRSTSAHTGVVEKLPPVEATYALKPADREKWNVAAPAGSRIEEAVWGSSGLSLVVIRRPHAIDVVRVRGFVPMTSRKWLDNFVKFTVRPEE